MFRRSTGGFTLIELLVTIGLLAVVHSVVYVVFSKEECLATMRTL